jgi:phage terminase Nu1 subunit (DNA packaging protein)
LKVKVATVHSWHRRGWIPCLRAGQRPVLFDLAEVENALRERGQKSCRVLQQRKETAAECRGRKLHTEGPAA